MSSYNTYGFVSHSDVAKKLQISTSLAHKVEGDAFMKFALGIFQPNWQVKNDCLRRLKDANGVPLCYGVGKCLDLLTEKVNATLQPGDDFQEQYEKNIVDISRNTQFRKFVIGILDPDSDE